jgi:diguanylate cyclase (GGDEF)-like protein
VVKTAAIDVHASELRHIPTRAGEIHFRSMHMHAAPDLQNFPDSPYAIELRRHLPRLRFANALEREFQGAHLARMHSRVRVVQLAIAALALAAALQLILLEQYSVAAIARSWLGLVIPVSLLQLWAAWSRHYARIYPQVARLTVPVVALTSAIGVAAHTQAGLADQFYFLSIYGMAMFFLGGQQLRASIPNIAVLLAAYSLTLIYEHQPPQLILCFSLVLTISAATGACICYGVERQARTSFLERGLLREMVARDSLTGLKNRGAFDEHFLRMWQQGMRERHALGVLLIDVDHFKAYNDRYGHQAGDHALRRVAQVVQGFARRPLDIAARYGGEEFLLGLYDLEGTDLSAIATELRNAIRAVAILHEDSPTAGVVTVSIGATLVQPKLECSPDGAIHAADKALYRAKRHGRDHVVCVELGDSNSGTATGTCAPAGDSAARVAVRRRA